MFLMKSQEKQTVLDVCTVKEQEAAHTEGVRFPRETGFMEPINAAGGREITPAGGGGAHGSD